MKTAISIIVGLLPVLFIQSCCNNIACDPPPVPSITIVISLDSLGSGFTVDEFSSIKLLKKTVYSDQEIIDTLSNNNWYYLDYSGTNPEYPRYDLMLGWEEGDQNYEYIITNNKDLEYIIDAFFLTIGTSNSRCCKYRVLSTLSFNFDNQRHETSEYYYDLIIEK